MPFTANPIDGCRIYFEDDGGDGPPIVILNGLGDPIVASRCWGVSGALAAGHRVVFVDHRGQGGSDKPHNHEAYATSLRVADLVAVLDELKIERAHFIGLSWGARLLFGVGEHAPRRVRTLTMAGQMPFRMDPVSPGVKMVTEAFDRGGSMADFIEALGALGDLNEDVWRWTLANDFDALAAAWKAATLEGDIAPGMAGWDFPCLIYAGTEDTDFFDGAKSAAAIIPGCRFVALEGLSHLEAHANENGVLPHIQALIDGAMGAS